MLSRQVCILNFAGISRNLVCYSNIGKLRTQILLVLLTSSFICGRSFLEKMIFASTQ